MIRIIADSTCDLSKDIIKQYSIKVISSKVIIGGHALNDFDYDGESLTQFYSALDEIKEAPGYSPPEPKEYLTSIEEGVFNGINDFIILYPSSQQINNFGGVIAKAISEFVENNRVPGVRIQAINTLNVSQGFGYSVLKAAKMAKQGIKMEEIVEYIEENKSKVKDFLSVPDVDFLYKTGNVTRTGANATKLLGITPILKLGTSGKATLSSKVIGENKVSQCFANEFLRHSDLKNTDFVIIGYSTDESKAIETKRLILQDAKFDGEIYIMQMRPAFGAHMGRRAVGIYFLGKQGTISIFNIFRSK